VERITLKADVLCIGGGPAGLMAAIRAAELGSSVIVADKSNTLYSGSAGAGNDHYMAYIPEVHGPDTKPILNEYLHHPQSGIRPEFARLWLENSFEIVKLWDSWGIPMKYKGKWEFAGHAFPGHPPTHLKYSGGNQKQVLTEQAIKRGSTIINRVTVFDLIADQGRITGAMGFDTLNNNLVKLHAKAVFLGTGGCARLFPTATPAWLFNTPIAPYATGDGRAMVYRAGGQLRDMEFFGQWAGTKYFCRAGKGSWIGVLRDPDGKPIGPFITKPDRVYGDVTSDTWPGVFEEYQRSGEGPVYMDCRGASRDDIEYMKYWLRHEGNIGMLGALDEQGIDLLSNAVEFYTYGITINGGVAFNTEAETSLKGLYSAGQEYGGSMAFATILGWIAGKKAAKYAKEVELPKPINQTESVNDILAFISSIQTRNHGATWQEANIALQQMMVEYSGLVRSETLLEQGLNNLSRLKQKVLDSLVARNGHEVGRCLETLNLIDTGEVVMLCARERKETRAKHRRTDFPFTNPLLDKCIFIRKEQGKPLFDWKAKKLFKAD
jgi:succinate dehydrogenase/fumarate reductase flavoprotein subunit